MTHRWKIFSLYFFASALLLYGFSASNRMNAAVNAQDGSTSQAPADVEGSRPFILPFAEPPSPDTWLMAQPYGNTTGAYRQRFSTYGASGGIHFGVDLSAPCGTEIVAIADGVVFAVDGPFGSPPHNLTIDHIDLGYASMYGHLLEAPDLSPGQSVRQGEVIAKVGDSRETCYSSPHLHLEIRDLGHIRKYNPTLLIEADWDNMALIGGSGRDFARDLDNPRKWQSLYDQPEVRTAGPIVNDFARPWPPDWEKGLPRAANTNEGPISVPLTTDQDLLGTDEDRPFGYRLTHGDCCTNLAWDQNSEQIRFIDRPNADTPLGLWAVDLSSDPSQVTLISPQLGYYSPDGSLLAYPHPENETSLIKRLSDGQVWEIDTQGRSPSFTPDGQHIIWAVFDPDAPRDSRLTSYWLADIDGSNPREILTARRISILAWLSSEEILLSQRVTGSSDRTISKLNIVDGQVQDLLTLPRPRGLTLSPDKRYLVYYLSFQRDVTQNGLWLLDLEASSLEPEKLPFFGAYRWRDAHSLIYVPHDPQADEHNFFEYDILSGQSRSLFPDGSQLIIANNDWQISPDGSKIALLSSRNLSLDGIWILDLPPIEVDLGIQTVPEYAGELEHCCSSIPAFRWIE